MLQNKKRGKRLWLITTSDNMINDFNKKQDKNKVELMFRRKICLKRLEEKIEL